MLFRVTTNNATAAPMAQKWRRLADDWIEWRKGAHWTRRSIGSFYYIFGNATTIVIRILCVDKGKCALFPLATHRSVYYDCCCCCTIAVVVIALYYPHPPQGTQIHSNIVIYVCTKRRATICSDSWYSCKHHMEFRRGFWVKGTFSRQICADINICQTGGVEKCRWLVNLVTAGNLMGIQ